MAAIFQFLPWERRQNFHTNYYNQKKKKSKSAFKATNFMFFETVGSLKHESMGKYFGFENLLSMF